MSYKGRHKSVYGRQPPRHKPPVSYGKRKSTEQDTFEYVHERKGPLNIPMGSDRIRMTEIPKSIAFEGKTEGTVGARNHVGTTVGISGSKGSKDEVKL